VEADVLVIVIIAGIGSERQHVLLDEAARAQTDVLDLGGKSEVHAQRPRLTYVRSASQRHHLPAVDDDGRARDEAARIGDKQKQRAVEIALLAEPAHGDLALDRGALLAHEILA